MKRYLCDWWMPSRSQCPMEGTERTADRYGAPLRFCKVHLPKAALQYPMPKPEKEAPDVQPA